MAEPDTRWHLDKRVPIGLIGAVLVQTISFVWFISKIDSRVSSLESGVVMQRDRDDRQDRSASEAAANVRSDLKEIDRKLDRLIERTIKP